MTSACRVVLISTILSISLSDGQKCFVEDQRGETKPCEFPWVLSNQTFLSCTDTNDPDGKLWCSTKVDEETRQHLRGKQSFLKVHKNLNFKKIHIQWWSIYFVR